MLYITQSRLLGLFQILMKSLWNNKLIINKSVNQVYVKELELLVFFMYLVSSQTFFKVLVN